MATTDQIDSAAASRRNAALARAARTEIANERFERYAQLRRGGFSIQEAAWDLGIARRTGDRYEGRMRQHRAQQGAA